MTTDEKHARIADALRSAWQNTMTGVTTDHLMLLSGLTVAQVRSVSSAYKGDGRAIQCGADNLTVRYGRDGVWNMTPAEGWPAYWARQPEALF